jgi:chromosome segregation ATPase
MRRSELVPLLLGLAACGVISLAATPVARASDPESRVVAEWRQRLDAGRDRLELATAQLESARDTYQDWRQRKYPRGKRKEELVAELKSAESELAKAEAAWVELQEDARRAGVPPGVLRDYE